MIFDGHSDIFTDVTIKRLTGEKNVLERYHKSRLASGGIEGGIFVIWVDPPYDSDYRKRTMEILKSIDDEMKETDSFVIVHNAEEMKAAKDKGQFYIFIGIEGMAAVGQDLDYIDLYYQFGARHAMLTWNEENSLATGVQGNPKRGLSRLGKQAVKLIQDKGMIMDVSHLNEKSFWDVMSVATGPVVASHSNSKALCGATRNLTDSQLKEIKNSGGLVGINSFNLFVSEDITHQNIENLVEHIVYISDLIGVEHVGFGFDFFEFLSADSMSSYSDQDTSYIHGLEDCSKVPRLLELLRAKGFCEDELELICRKNWQRIVEQVL